MGLKTISLVAIALVALVSFQKASCARLPSIANANETIAEEEKDVAPLIDYLMANFDSIARNLSLEPMKIPDLTSKFSKKILFVTFRAGASLTRGLIRGISTLHRTGKCTIQNHETGITIKTDMGVKRLRITFRGSAYAFSESFRISVDIEANVENLRIFAEIFQANGPESHGILRDFNILHMDLDIHVNGLGPIGWIINPLIKLARKLFRSQIDDLIEDKAEKAIAKALLKYHLPLSNNL